MDKQIINKKEIIINDKKIQVKKSDKLSNIRLITFIAALIFDILAFIFKELEIPMTLSEVNIDETYFDQMAKHAVQYNSLNHAYVALKEKDIIEILKSCL